jgi:uncharacterized membrane protein (Fun14 family)
MSVVAIPVAYELAVGGLGGYFIGYALKKITKFVALLIGIVILAVIYLAYSGLLNINFEGFANETKNALTYLGQAFVNIAPFLTNLPLLGSFFIGLFLAYKMA